MDHYFLENYLNELLDVERFQDYCPNGLQIEGRPKINKIATAVTASRFVIERCLDLEVDALLVHHGFFWKGEPPSIRGLKKNRIAPLMKHDINLYGYHLPLDAYEAWGNNASIAKRLDIHVMEKREWNHCSNILWFGMLSSASEPQKFLNTLKQSYGKQVLHISGGKQEIKHVAWCSGAGQDFFELASQYPIDAYITGEFSERTYYLAKELQIDFYALGHYASEEDGIKHLGEFLAQEFKLPHVFIQEDNPF